MGIYIKNLKLPPCGATIVLIYPNGNVCEMKYGSDQWKLLCQAIVLPPHGRLIDADRLGIMDAEKQAYEAYLREKSEFFVEEPLLEYMRGRLEGLTDASGRVKFAPTVIPAEESE